MSAYLAHGLDSHEEQLNEKLRDMSRARMGTWNNTLEARRAQKENEHASRKDEEEKLRQVQDRKEAAFQAGERRRIIQRANTLLYENTERVKAFGSKLYLSDVMKEREMQMELKKRRDDRLRAEERMWHERTVEGVRKGDEEEAKKQDEAMQRALHAKQVQLDQLEEFRVRYVTNKLDERREGQLIKQRVLKYIQDEKQAEIDKKTQEAAKALHTMKDNKRLQEEKRLAEQQAREDEERRIQYFAEEKERKMKLRAEREAEIAANKQAVRQRMIDTLPDIKVVITLRDPVSRAYSHYWHTKRHGFEPHNTFEAAVAAEPERLAVAERRMATAVPPASSFGFTRRDPLDKRFKLRWSMLFERARLFEAALAA